MGRVVHFELPAGDPEEIAAFYRRVFGWEIMKWEGPVDYWLVSTGPETEPGIHGGIARKEGRPASGVLVTIAVNSVDEALQQVIRSGGTVVVPKTVIPGVGYQAHFRDPEGYVVGLLENDPDAR
jgi:uncharacterized protein